MASATRSFRPTPLRVLPAALLILGSALAALPVAAQVVDVSPATAEAALTYLREQAPVLGISAADLAGLVVATGHTSDRSGLTYLYVRQQLDGLDVVGAQVTVAVGRDGRVVHTTGDLVAGIAAAALPAAGGNRAASLGAESALRAAARHAGILLGAVATEAVDGGPAQATRLQAAGLSSTAQARQVYVQTAGGALRRAWEVTLDDARSVHWWVLTVDAATGTELSRHDLTVSETFGVSVPSFAPVAAPASVFFDADALAGDARSGGARVAGYQVFPLPFASPLYVPSPPPADGRSAVSGVEDATASPFGWHDTNGAAGAEFTTTRGNNTHTYIDRNDDELPDAAPYLTPDGGAALSFNFPLSFAAAPTTYTSAAAVNLFYWSNIIHDITYRYGFTEAAGNFQANQYGRGGAAGADAVDSEVQSGADICNEVFPCENNANFATPVDGNRPRMQMYVGTSPTPDIDGSFDAHVVVHEYGHGISFRLVAGGASGCLDNDEQMGEGWSDIYGNLLTMRTGDTRTTLRTVGNYLFGQPANGGGIRPSPYTTDFGVNNFTYQRTRTQAVPHGVGFVWATILWEVTWDLIDAHGFSPNLYNAAGPAGNQIMMSLVTEGLKLTPCNPGFVSGRDAIFAADAALYPDAGNPGRGLHYTTLWTAFARRGLGFSASQGLTSLNSDNVQAFDVPLPAGQAQVASAAISRMAGPGGTATASVAVSNTGAPGSGSVIYSSTLQNLTFVPQARPAAPVARAVSAPAPTGEIVVRGAAAKGDAETSETAPPAAPEASFAGGGPDALGYRWDDSNEPGGPVYAFTSIAATGTAVVLGDDTASPAIPLPFSFSFYGTAYTTVFIGSNGILSFGAGTTTFANVAIPTAAVPNTFIAPFWDDLAPNLGGTIHYQTVGTDFVVQFTNVRRFSTGTGTVSFQVILKPSGEIRFQYQSPPTTNNEATIGIENQTGSVGLQVAFNAAYAAPNLAVRFRRGRTWVTASNGAGTVAPGAATSIGLAFDGTGLTEGTYTADLVVTTNSSSGPTTTIPLAFTIGGRATVAGVAGWRLLSAPAVGMTVDNLAALNLVQGVPGFYPGVQTNLFTGYTGTAYTPSTGTGQVLGAGRGFWWYFFNQNLTPGGSSNSVALPMTLATTLPAATADVPVALHAAGTKFNLLGNPFGTSLSFTGLATWPGATNLASNVAQVWDANAATYDVSVVYPTVSPWQGFWVEGNTAGTLTIPASARTTGGVLERADPAPLVAFTLAQADGPLQDRAAALTFPEGATDGTDLADAAKLAPFAGTYVSAAFEATSEDAAGSLRAVESRPAPTEASVSVPLHVASVGAGEALVLSWPLVEAVPEGWAMTLTDLATGTTVDLRTASSYAFTVAPEAARDPLDVSAARPAAAPARFTVTVGPRGATAGEGTPTAELSLEAPRPNPSRGASTVGFSLPAAGAARLSVVDLLGREVAVLVDGEQAAGRHTATVDASRLAPGVYVLRLTAGTEALTRRLVVVR